MRSRIMKIAFLLLLSSLLWCITLGNHNWRYGDQEHATKSDCIIIEGAVVQGSTSSPAFAERILQGTELYPAGLATKLLFTEGVGEGQDNSEGRVGRSAAIRLAVAAVDILIEERSQTTRQNLSEARSVMQKHGLNSALIVRVPIHVKRAMMIAGGLDIDAVSSPTSTTRYRSFQNQFSLPVRELSTSFTTASSPATNEP